jgi:hypothetical protein
MIRAVVCGLPDSGNRLVQKIVEKAGGQAKVWHGQQPWRLQEEYPPTHIIVPVRAYWQLAFEANYGPDYSAKFPHVATSATTLGDMRTMFETGRRAQIAKWELPTYEVSYERLVDDPDGEIEALCEWLNVDVPRELPEVFNANAKYGEAAGV